MWGNEKISCFPKAPSTSREVFHWKDPLGDLISGKGHAISGYKKNCPEHGSKQPTNVLTCLCNLCNKSTKQRHQRDPKTQGFWLKAKILLSSNNHDTVKKKLGIPPVYNHAMSFTKKGFQSFSTERKKSWDISTENLGIWPQPLKPWAWRRDSKCTARCQFPRFWQALKNAWAVDVGHVFLVPTLFLLSCASRRYTLED